MRHHTVYWPAPWLACAAALTLSACGMVIDQDRLAIAEIDGEEVTRGDFNRAIRELPAEEKPIIATRGDARMALERYIDTELRRINAEELIEEGAITVPDEAVRRHFYENNEDLRSMMGLLTITDASQVEMTQYELDQARMQLEEALERSREKVAQSEGMRYRILEAIQSQKFQISREEWEAEFEIKKAEGRTYFPAQADLNAIMVAEDTPDAQSVASEARQRLADGEPIAEVGADLEAAGTGEYVGNMGLAADGRDQRFQRLWPEFAAMEPGDIIGPSFLAGGQAQVPNPQTGQPQLQEIPGFFMVAELISYTEPKEMTLEEAKPLLEPAIVYAKVMEQFKEDRDVQIIEENLPIPGASHSTGPSGPLASSN